jgi:hypothetical protein
MNARANISMLAVAASVLAGCALQTSDGPVEETSTTAEALTSTPPGFPAGNVTCDPNTVCSWTAVPSSDTVNYGALAGFLCSPAYQFVETPGRYSYYVAYCQSSRALGSYVTAHDSNAFCGGVCYVDEMAWATTSSTQRTVPDAGNGFVYVRWIDGVWSDTGGGGGKCQSGCNAPAF